MLFNIHACCELSTSCINVISIGTLLHSILYFLHIHEHSVIARAHWPTDVETHCPSHLRKPLCHSGVWNIAPCKFVFSLWDAFFIGFPPHNFSLSRFLEGFFPLNMLATCLIFSFGSSQVNFVYCFPVIGNCR